MQESNLFTLAKSYDLRDYLQLLGIELSLKGNSTCPFCKKKNKFGIFNSKDGTQAFRCFSSECDKAGDIIKFNELFFNLSPLDSAKKILKDNGEDINFQDKDYEKIIALRTKEAQEKAQKEAEKLKRYQCDAALKMQNLFKTQLQNKLTLYSQAYKEIKKSFPLYEELPDYLKDYIGFDIDNNAITIANYYKDEFFNLKTHHKANIEGKWLSFPYSKIYPFPLKEFNPDCPYVFLVEGEKDALHLSALGINTLTLGGVGNKYDDFLYLLKDKIIYLFYDHDEAGYINYYKKSLDLKSVAKEIYIIPFFFLKPHAKKGYDVSDFIIEKNLLNPFSTIEERRNLFFETISFSTFLPNANIFETISKRANIDPLKFNLTPKINFKTISKTWLNHVVKIKGELDPEFDILLEATQDYLKENKKEFEPLINELKALSKNSNYHFKNLIHLKSQVLNQYRQIHASDTMYAFLNMARNSSHPLFNLNSNLYAYSGKHYLLLKEEELVGFMTKEWANRAKYQIKSHTAKNIYELIDNLKAFSDNLSFRLKEESSRHISLNNGTLSINSYGQISFTPNHSLNQMCFSYLNFDYDPLAKANKWQKFLDQVLPDSKEQDCLSEYLGYCLLPSHRFETFMFLVGVGGSGKSTILEIFTKFLSNDKISRLQMQQFTGHDLDVLNDKILNIGSELDPKAMYNGQFEILKALVSNTDEININPKHKNPYTLKKQYQPKFIFAGNKKPNGIRDDSGFFRRMLMLTFSNPIQNKIYDISSRFDDELSGILNWALQGLERLIKNNAFSISEQMTEELESYKDEQNPMRGFIKDCIKIDNLSINSSYKGKYVYDVYKKWTQLNGSSPLGYYKFLSNLKEQAKAQNIEIINKKDGVGNRLLAGFILETGEINE